MQVLGQVTHFVVQFHGAMCAFGQFSDMLGTLVIAFKSALKPSANAAQHALHPRRPVFLKSLWPKPHTGHFWVDAPFSISSAAPIPRSRSASAKPVGSCTPFSFEQASQRFTFCILPSRICVRKTVASLHLQTSHNISLN